MPDRSILPLVALAAFGLLLFVLERIFPLRKATRGLIGRLVINLAFSALALATVYFLVRPVVEMSFGRLAETNSNYGVVFPWWDRLHRTLGLNVPQSAITIGVPGYSNPDDNRLWEAVWMPFRKQRDYWRGPEGSVVERDDPPQEGNRHRLAE